MKEWHGIVSQADKRRAGFRQKNQAVFNQVKALVDIDQDMNSRWAASDHNHELEMKMAALDDSVSTELMKLFDQ